MARSLDDFLASEAGEGAGQAEATEPSVAVVTPEQRRETERETNAPDARREPSKPPEADKASGGDDADDAALPETEAGIVAALRDERAKRRDHKGRADRLDGELASLRAEMEALRKAAINRPAPQEAPRPAAPQAPPMQIPDLKQDPVGYLAYLAHVREQDRIHDENQRFSDRLDNSEGRLRDRIGDDADVDAKVARFKELAKQNPALGAELRKHPHPYKFAYDYASKMATMDEIGSDPVAYRKKLVAEAKAEALAEARAQIEAENAANQQSQGAQQQTQSRVVLPQSLGTARSAGPRSAPMPDAPAFEDIFRKRKRA